MRSDEKEKYDAREEAKKPAAKQKKLRGKSLGTVKSPVRPPGGPLPIPYPNV